MFFAVVVIFSVQLILVTVWIVRPLLGVRNTMKSVRRLKTYPKIVFTVGAYSIYGNELTIVVQMVRGILIVL